VVRPDPPFVVGDVTFPGEGTWVASDVADWSDRLAEPTACCPAARPTTLTVAAAVVIATRAPKVAIRAS
jgi:hypothetical protein